MSFINSSRIKLLNGFLEILAVCIFCLVSSSALSQDIKEVEVRNLTFELNKDTTELVIKQDGIALNGKYKMISNANDKAYSITNFVDGKAIGVSESYRMGILVGTTELKNGLKNGYSIVYDQTGKKMIWKIHMVNGFQHGHAWYVDKGDTYYIKGKVASKEAFEKYERDKN